MIEGKEENVLLIFNAVKHLFHVNPSLTSLLLMRLLLLLLWVQKQPIGQRGWVHYTITTPSMHLRRAPISLELHNDLMGEGTMMT